MGFPEVVGGFLHSQLLVTAPQVYQVEKTRLFNPNPSASLHEAQAYRGFQTSQAQQTFENLQREREACDSAERLRVHLSVGFPVGSDAGTGSLSLRTRGPHRRKDRT